MQGAIATATSRTNESATGSQRLRRRPAPTTTAATNVVETRLGGPQCSRRAPRQTRIFGLKFARSRANAPRSVSRSIAVRQIRPDSPRRFPGGGPLRDSSPPRSCSLRNASANSRTSRHCMVNASRFRERLPTAPARPARVSSTRSEFTAAVQPRHDRPDRARRSAAANLLVCHVLHVAEQDDLLMMLRNASKAAEQHVFIRHMVWNGEARTAPYSQSALPRRIRSPDGPACAPAIATRAWWRMANSQARQLVPGEKRWNDCSACCRASPGPGSSASIAIPLEPPACRNSRSTCGIASASNASHCRFWSVSEVIYCC